MTIAKATIRILFIVSPFFRKWWCESFPGEALWEKALLSHHPQTNP
jgi:hypothetical protein